MEPSFLYHSFGISRSYQYHATEYKEYANPDISKVKRIGIDEFAVRKGHVYKTIIVDLDTGRIIYVGDGRGSSSLTDFWKRLKRRGVQLELVTSDMSATYILAVKENASEAIHVYDKFHVVQLVNEAVFDCTCETVLLVIFEVLCSETIFPLYKLSILLIIHYIFICYFSKHLNYCL